MISEYDRGGSRTPLRLLVKANGKIYTGNAAAYASCGGLYVLQYTDADEAEADRKRLADLSNVEYVEYDAVATIAETDGYSYSDDGSAASGGHYSDNENPSNVSEAVIDNYLNTVTATPESGGSALNASDASLSYAYNSWGAGITGADLFSSYLVDSAGLSALPEVVVAVLDSGIDSAHPLFAGRIAAGGRNFSSSESASSAYDCQDDNGHGTHVSGIIADLTLPNVKILPVKIISAAGAASYSAIIAALYYISDLKTQGINICAVNLSLSSSAARGSYVYQLYLSALKTLYNKNVIPVAAAGNNGKDVSDFAPGNVADGVFTVSSIKRNGDGYTISSTSNYGSGVDFTAPGDTILSAKLNGGYVEMSGTSMATPHVSSVIALLLSDPVNAAFTAKQTETYLKASATDLGSSGFDNYYGYGIIYAARGTAAAAVSEMGGASSLSADESAFGEVTSDTESGASVPDSGPFSDTNANYVHPPFPDANIMVPLAPPPDTNDVYSPIPDKNAVYAPLSGGETKNIFDGGSLLISLYIIPPSILLAAFLVFGKLKNRAHK
ncbi:MAG: S8 family serine peptidase [Clostridiales bacterium]|nr:S8 family serine peptidase [Clostridiales bacterium]